MSDSTAAESSSRKRTRSESEGLEGPGAKKSRDIPSVDLLKRTKKKRSKGNKRKRKMSVTAPILARTDSPALSGRPALATPAIPPSDGEDSDQETIGKEAPPRAGPSKHGLEYITHQTPPQVNGDSQNGKGKERESRQTSSEDAPQDATARVIALEQQLEEKTKLLDKHHSALAHIQSNITCQICLDLMYKPFALAPCGHLACYSCLVSWFKAPPSNEQEFGPPIMARRKTCPHCRAVVRERPVEVWDVKNIVLTLSKSGLLPSVEGTHDTANDPIPPDPWEGMFRPVVPRGPNLFPGFFHHAAFDHDPAPPAPGAGGPDMGMYDVEDGGVYRCLDCMHEIFRGRCTSCNRTYPGHHDFDEDEEDYEDMPFDMDEDDLSELEEAMMVGWHYPFYGGMYDEDEDEEDDEGSEYDFHDPFIDDVGALHLHHSDEVGGASTEELTDSGSDNGSPSGAFIVELDSDGNEVPELEAAAQDDVRGASPVQNGDSDSDESDGPLPPRRLTTSRRPIFIGSDDPPSEDEEISFAPRRPSRSRGLLLSDDEDAEEGDTYEENAAEGDSYEDDGSLPGPPNHLLHYLDDEVVYEDEDSGASDDYSEQEEDMLPDY